MFTNFVFSRRPSSSEKRVYARAGSTDRYVSAHAPHRIARRLCSVLVLIAVAFASPLHAEERQGDAIQIIKNTTLRREATEDSESLGRLPAGTILTSKGQRRGRYVFVEVELEQGDTLEGWITQDSLDRQVEEVDSLTNPEKKRPKIRSGKIHVPEDESLLLRRESTFFYGLSAGGNYSFLQTQFSNAFYSGVGFTAGGHIGTFLTKEFPFRFETSFTKLTGSSATDTTGLTLDFNFLDLAVLPSFVLLNTVEIFGGLQYSLNLGVGDTPQNIAVTSGDLSTFGFQCGAGYRFNIAYQTELAVRAKYYISFIKYPFSYQSISLLVALDIQG